ncbi:uncharacterized protein F5891DRAFT_1195649 [Suillus fuscotomentosus]|uniref:Uncharacterized protein n=1 Tax=Suillus fuscotomentosus TaxID=1912939 RepID=A0AAD4HEX7_9AGAM|nr:uncharacterized protein F5891DRAFT_1195649 [Suillus fuscotomentosus]KAG1894088.1 hypothetical protein F5891DRAFT_1195649 [Suillus fuscotomentosus]
MKFCFSRKKSAFRVLLTVQSLSLGWSFNNPIDHFSQHLRRAAHQNQEVGSINLGLSASTPPTSIAPSSSPILLRSKTPVDDPTLQIDEFSTVVLMKSVGDSGRHKRPIQYSLFRGGLRDEDCRPPTKRLKTLQTTWNSTPEPSSEATNYLNECMLELSRITRRAIATRMRYQRLCSRELDLIKSILEDEQDLAQTQMKGFDVQIGSLRNILQDAGVMAIGNKGCRSEPSDIGPWCESSSDESDGPGPAPMVSKSLHSSACTSDLEE